MQQTVIRALIVEDEPFNQYAFKLILDNSLKEFNISLDSAMNGLEALDMICGERSEGQESFKYDVIFMDINMPVMDGLEATKRLRQLEEEGKINMKDSMLVMHSAIHHTLTQEKALFDRILPKPIPVEELRDIFFCIESYKLISE